MFDAAVEIGVATFLHRKTEVRASLEAAGVAPWLSQRLALFLPLAFGRRLFADQVTIADGFLEGAEGTLRRRRAWSSEPLWAAAVARAARANRAEMQAIGLASAELEGVNRALNAGAKMEDLSLGPCALGEPLLPAPSLEAAPSSAGHGGLPSPRQAFHALLAGHGFSTGEDGKLGEAVFAARVYPRFHPKTLGVQVDFAVTHPALACGTVLESFAGWGTTWDEALSETIEKFERSSFHVLVAGLLAREACADQVVWERASHPSGPFDVCLGPQLVLYSSAPAPATAPLIDALYAALAERPLSRQTHALRVFTLLLDGELNTVEVLLDNEPWPAGEQVVRAAAWPSEQGALGTRLFLLLLPSVDGN